MGKLTAPQEDWLQALGLMVGGQGLAGGAGGDRPAGTSDGAQERPPIATLPDGLRTGRMTAGPEDEAPGGGGDGGDGDGDDGLSDAQRKEQLKQWKQDGKVKGDVDGLREALGDKKNKALRQAAQGEFRRLREEIAKGTTPTVQELHFAAQKKGKGGGGLPRDQLDQGDPDGSKGEMISDGGGKISLETAVKAAKVGLDPRETDKFGRWLIDTHTEAEVHEHLKSPANTRRVVLTWMEETGWDTHANEKLRERFNAVRDSVSRDRDSGGRGSRGGGGGDGGHGGNAPPSRSDPPAGGHGGDSAAKGRAKGGGSGSSGQPSTHANADGSSHVHAKAIEQFIRNAEALKAMSTAPKVDSADAKKKRTALESDADKLVEKLRAMPELSKIGGSTKKEFFANIRQKFAPTVRTGAANIVLLAMNAADAYEMLQAVGSILDSKDIKEGLQKSFELGKSIVKGEIVFGALRLVLRSNPAAVFVMIITGSDSSRSDHGRGVVGVFEREVAKVVNQIEPGSVEPASHISTMPHFKGNGEKLFNEALEIARQSLKDDLTSSLETFGYKDGLTGTKARSKFEVSAVESKVLRVDGNWLGQRYRQGFARGDQALSDAIKRVSQAGFKAGQEGKETNFLSAVVEFSEFQALNHRSQTRESDGDFDFTRTFDRYKSAFEEGYQQGKQGFDTRTPAKLRIPELNPRWEKLDEMPLVAVIDYSNGTTRSVSKEADWSVSPSSAAEISYSSGRRVMVARLLGAGRTKFTVRYQDDGQSMEGRIDVDIQPLTVSIRPAEGTYSVGQEIQFSASNQNRWPLGSPGIRWGATPGGIVQIDANGKAVMLKPGNAEITVTEREAKKAAATAKIKVVAGP